MGPDGGAINGGKNGGVRYYSAKMYQRHTESLAFQYLRWQIINLYQISLIVYGYSVSILKFIHNGRHSDYNEARRSEL